MREKKKNNCRCCCRKMWGCGKKMQKGKVLAFFRKSTFLFFLQLRFLVEVVTKGVGAFFPLNGWEALAKKSFSVAGKIREKVLAKMRLLWSFFQKTEQRKAFYIISNYRQRWCWFASNEASAEWKATVCVGNCV